MDLTTLTVFSLVYLGMLFGRFPGLALDRTGVALLGAIALLAGNPLIVGSIVNIIIVEQAARFEVKISWREHARVGVPVTVITLALAAAWIWLKAA